MANRPAVEAKGLNKFRSDLRRADKAVAKELQAELKGIAATVAAEAGGAAPSRSGTMAAAYRGVAVGSKAVVRNRILYSRFIEFGFHPGGGSTFVPGRNLIGQAIERQEDRIVDELGDAIERAATKVGWH
jgi:hypothetical protein